MFVFTSKIVTQHKLTPSSKGSEKEVGDSSGKANIQFHPHSALCICLLVPMFVKANLRVPILDFSARLAVKFLPVGLLTIY